MMKPKKIRYKTSLYPNLLRRIKNEDHLYLLCAVLFCISDIQVCMEGMSYGKKANVNYYLRMALSHIRELLSVMYKNESVLSKILGNLDEEVQRIYRELKDVFIDETSGKYHIQDEILKGIRTSSFHYPNPKRKNDFPGLSNKIGNIKELKIGHTIEVKEKYSLMDQKYKFAEDIQASYTSNLLNDQVFAELVKVSLNIMILGDALIAYFQTEDMQ